MKKLILKILLLLIPLLGFCQESDYRKVKLNEILDYQSLLYQITHVGPEYIKRQPIISKLSLIDSLDLYSATIDSYMIENFGKGSKVWILFEIILESEKFENILNEKIDNMYMMARAYDKESGSFYFMISFLADIGEKGIKHLPSVEFCFKTLQEANAHAQNPSPVIVPLIYYIKRLYFDDEKVEERLVKLLEEKKFFNSDYVRGQYERMSQKYY